MAETTIIVQNRGKRMAFINHVFDWRSWQFTADAWKRSGRKMRIIGFAWGWFGIGVVWGWKGESNGN